MMIRFILLAAMLVGLRATAQDLGTLLRVDPSGAVTYPNFWTINAASISAAIDLPLYVPVDRTISTTGSLIGGGALSANLSLSLEGDNATPGNLRYYGTDASGTKGWYPLPEPDIGGLGDMLKAEYDQNANGIVDAAESVAWDDVTGKPSTFPPAVHEHSWTNITDKPSVFPPDTHTHSWTSITDKPSVFPPDIHTHHASNIVAGVIAPARLGSGSPTTNTYLRGDSTWAEFPSLDGGISDAPNDGKIYRRKNASWFTANTLEGLQIDGGVFSNTVTLNNRALLGFMKFKGATTNTPDEHWKIATIQPSGAGQSATLFVRSIGGSVSAANKGIVELMVANRNAEQITYWVRGTKPTQYSIKVYREDDNSLSVYAYLPGAANQFNGFGLDAWMGNWENPASFTSQVYLNPEDVGPSPTGTLIFDATSATPDWHQPHQGTPTVMGNTIWHQGNDGAGSGLDADLLDGLSSTAFATASHTHSASDITSGVFNPSLLGTGTNISTKFLRGDGTWQTIETGGGSFDTNANYEVSGEWTFSGYVGFTDEVNMDGPLHATDIILDNPVAISAGGTGATTANTARENLGLAIGVDVQAYNPTLDDVVLAGLQGSGPILRASELGPPNQGPIINVYTNPGTHVWLKPAGAKTIKVWAFGAGGGGGSGRRGADNTVRSGGGGGGPGGYSFAEFPADLVSTNVSVTVGAGGTGGPGRTTNNTNGQAGDNGGHSFFGDLVWAGGGQGGAGGTDNGATGGFSNGGMAYANAGGAGSTTGGVGNVGNPSGTGSGISMQIVPTGGGGGGGLTTANAAFAGGDGGAGAKSINGTPLPGGTAGAAGSGAPGGNGSPGTSVHPWRMVGGTGGGGGGATDLSSDSDGGAGGDGGYPGGGGGGGGASPNGSDSGSGGNGANGLVVVIAY